MKVKLIAKTEICDQEISEAIKAAGPEALIMYCARVSNPSNQLSSKTGLLSYCADHGHWSIFEMADMVFEIETSRAISAQILRHRSFSFQEFSQRYAKVQEFETYEARRQDVKNRQNSIDDLSDEVRSKFEAFQKTIQASSEMLYEEALKLGVAKEQARFLLPMSTKTRLYMKGSLRSWIHYLEVRCDAATQKEHRDIALAIRDAIANELPSLAEAVGWPTLTQTNY